MSVQPAPPRSIWRAIYADLFVGYTTFEKIFYPAIILLQVAVLIISPEDIVSSIVAISGVICVALVGKGRISNYFFGIIQNALYLPVAFAAVFYGETMIGIFYLLTQFWGLYTWRKNLSQESDSEASDVKTRRIGVLGWLTIVALIALGTWLYGMLLEHIGSNQPYVDACSVTIAVIAQILMVYRFREQWLLWLLLNINQVYLWSTASNWPMMFMYIAFMFNSMYGWYNWTKLSRPSAETTAEVAAVRA